MDSYSHLQKRPTILLVSITLHAIILLLLLIAYEKADHFPIKPLDLLSQSPLEDAQVIFQDVPEQMEQREQNEITHAPAMAEPHIFEEPEEVESEPASKETVLEKPVASPTRALEHIPLVTELPIPKPIAKPIEQPAPPKKRKKRTSSGPSKKQQEAATALRNLTYGVVKNMEQERGTVPKVQEDMDELIRQMYQTKVYAVMKQSFRNVPIYQQKDIHTKAYLTMTIDKKGKLLDFRLEHPDTQSPELDKIETILKQYMNKAGLFPPIPSSFKSDKITLHFGVNIRGDKGLHLYRFEQM